MAATSSAKTKSPSNRPTTFSGSDRGIWHKSAPETVRKGFSAGGSAGDSAGNSVAGWTAFCKHLVDRPRPVDLAELFPIKENSLDWALPEGFQTCPEPDWLDSAKPTDVFEWLDESADGPSGETPDVGHALQMLACAHALPRLAGRLPAEPWWALLGRLLSAVADSAGIDLEKNPLVHQLLAGELPLTLAYLLPEIAPCRKLRSGARRALSSGLVDLLDGEGVLRAKDVWALRPLLACWTRCRALSSEIKGGSWTSEASEQYEWFVRHALRLTRHDGSHAFSNGSARTGGNDLFRAALKFDNDDDDHDIATLALPGGKKSDAKRISEADLPEPAVNSEWASIGVLRRRWLRSTAQLTVLYHEPSLWTEFAVGKDVLWSGPWTADVRLNGQTVVPDSDWEEVCWVSDEDVDFLELELELTEGIRLQRQMVLAREDRFLFLADVILGTQPGKLEYRGCLPLGADVSFQADDEGREGFLVGSKPRALVMPLALPEWREDRRVGELTQTDDGLELTQSVEGSCLYAPLWFDLDRRRMTRRKTWRQLTVAESLSVQPLDVAAGYRVAVGKEQWLVYRSLAERANRTLLGHNLSCEMLIGQFDSSGEVEPLVEVE
ncbi:MAG: hypothetical protein V3R99_05855 [Thermoguttaceae bacterium]